MLDIESVTESAEAVVEIKHPVTGAPTGATVTLAGPEHPKRKKIVFDRQRRLRAKFQKAGKLQFTDPEEEEQESIDYLAACTLGWSGIGASGKEIKFSEQAAAELYGKPEMAWLRAQIAEALEARENFIRSSGSA
jgi:hypothetical protein